MTKIGSATRVQVLAIVALCVVGCQPCKDAAECTAAAKTAMESKDAEGASAAAKRGCDFGSQESCMIMMMASAALPLQTKESCRKGDSTACALLKGVFREDPQQDVAVQTCTSGNYNDAFQICENIPENTKEEIKFYNRNYRRKCFDALSGCFLEHNELELSEKAARKVDLTFRRGERLVEIGLREIQAGNAEKGRSLISGTLKELKETSGESGTLARLSTKLKNAGELELAASSYQFARDSIHTAEDPSAMKWNLMNSMLEQKNFDEAIALVSGPDEGGLRTQGKSRVARALFESGEKERARQLFRDAIEETKSLAYYPKEGAISKLSYDLWDLSLFDLAKEVVALDPPGAEQRLRKLEARKKSE